MSAWLALANRMPSKSRPRLRVRVRLLKPPTALNSTAAGPPQGKECPKCRRRFDAELVPFPLSPAPAAVEAHTQPGEAAAAAGDNVMDLAVGPVRRQKRPKIAGEA